MQGEFQMQTKINWNYLTDSDSVEEIVFVETMQNVYANKIENS